MKKLIYLFTFFIPLLAFGQVDSTLQEIDSTLSQKEYELKMKQLTDDFANYKSTIEKKNSEVDSSLTRIDSLLNVATLANAEKIKLLNEKLQVIEKKESDNLNTRLKASQTALTEMKNGLTIINFVNEILELQSQVTKVTNIWENEELRNGWDKAQTWGTVIGTLIAGISLASGEQDLQSGGAAIGISAIGLTSILKQLFGKETAKHYEMIDLSRKAYDDLVILNSVLRNYIESNNILETELDSLKSRCGIVSKKYKEGNIKQDEVKAFIIQVIDKLEDYNKTLNQIPKYIAQIDGMVLTYAYKYYENEELKEILNELSEKSQKLNNKYETKVKPILDVSPSIKQTLMGI